MLKSILVALLLVVVCFDVNAEDPDLVRYVNTLQGTNSDHTLTRGNTYPTIGMPFGMHTWSPQTGENGSGWKYQYAKDSIRGFQQAHQCSSWTRDYCVFSLMPISGDLVVDQYARAAKFSHENEVAKPHFYSVVMDNGVRTEISPTERGAYLRFSFKKRKDAYVVLDGYTGLSEVKIDPKKKQITGYVSNGEGVKEGFRSYFIICFDAPFVSYGTWDNTTGEIVAGSQGDRGKGKGVYIQFAQGAVVDVKTASSYISPEQALVSLRNESNGDFFSFGTVLHNAYKRWNDLLNRVVVEGGTEEDKATFYSCLFRASIFSRKFYEVDDNGNAYYRSPNDCKVYRGYYYTDTGFWDTFRAQFPLTCLLHPTMQGRYMQAMLAAKQQSGWLPSWAFPSEAGSMIGNHAISLFADAWAKGIRTFDPHKALEAYHYEATNKGPWGPANGRDGYKDYYALGYVPYPKVGEATAKTLEYAYDDFCGYALAKAVGSDHYANIFKQTMFNYKNVYDNGSGFMRGRQENGQWVPNFDPIEWGGPYTEGCAWHYLWSVFHDVNGLINLMGGENRFNEKLDSVFTSANSFKVGTYNRVIHEMKEMEMMNMGQYAHGNQPIQHMVYLYNYSGEPWKAQQKSREVMRRMYNSTENGYPGDEDQGQTSSWYVLSAMGFYSVCPGTDQYVLGSPKFPKMTITFENGDRLVINAKNNSEENVYIESAKLNGEPFTKNYLTYEEIVNGGQIDYVMSSKPNKNRGVVAGDRPFSVSRQL